MNLADILWDFDAALREGGNPQIEEALQLLDDRTRSLDLLVELIRCELSYKHGAPGILEEHLVRFGELRGAHAHVVTLILHEYRERRQGGTVPAWEEYLQRFPDYAEALLSARWEETARSSVPGAAGVAEDSFSPPDTHPDRPASQPRVPALPGYEILGELGRGGMGVVYKARQVRLVRIVALKMILAGPYAGEEHLARFRTEAEAAARLQHPNIVPIYEIGDLDGLPYLALEYVDGGSLRERLQVAPLPPGQAADLVETLARAMHYAHQRGVVHRDLKPANVLLTADGAPKITDFGLAKKLDAERGQTRSGAVLGTPSYMAPEQADGKTKQIGPITDVYALGAILYEALTGRPPFQGESVTEVLDQVRMQEPVSPGQLRPKLPRDLETICLKCLQKEPRKRYPSAEALAKDLRRFLDREPIEARPVSQFERGWSWCRRKPGVASLLAALVLALLGGLAGEFARLDAEKRKAVEEKRAASAEADAARLQTREQLADSKRKEAERMAAQAEAAEWERRAAVAEAEHFNQEAALFYAKALEKFDRPKTRSRWMETAQRALVPVETAWPEGDSLPPNDQLLFFNNPSALCAEKHLLLTAGREADAALRSWDPRTFRQGLTYGGLEPLRYQDKHFCRVTALAIHPDGSRFVSAEPNGDLIWWETATGKQLRSSKAAHKPRDLVEPAKQADWDLKQLPPSWLTVTALAWSHDGKRVASAGVDGRLKLWDPETGKLMAEGREEVPQKLYAHLTGSLRQDAENLEASACLGGLAGLLELPQDVLLFDRADAHLITAGRDRVIRLWRLDKPEVVGSLPGPVPRINAAALSADGKLLASGGEEGVVIIWDLPKQVQQRAIFLKPLRTPDFSRSRFRVNPLVQEIRESYARRQYAVVRSLAFAPNGRWLAVVLGDGSVSLADLRTGDVHYRGVGHESDGLGKSLVTAYFTKEGELVTVGGDETIRHWDLPAWSTGRQDFPPFPLVSPVSRSTAGTGWVVLTGGSLWQWVAPKQPLQREWNAEERVTALGSGRSDGKVVLSTESGRALVFDLKAGKPVAEFRGPDGTRQPRPLLAPPQRRVQAQQRPLPSPIAAVAIQRDGRLAASSWEDGSVDLWDMTAPDRGAWTIPGAGPQVLALAFSPDGRQLAVAYANGAQGFWDVAAGKWQFQDLHIPGGLTRLCYAPPNGRELVRTGPGALITIWDPASGKPLRTFQGHQEVVEASGARGALIPAAAYSPDGKWLATGGTDGTIRLWDVQNHYRPLAVLSTAPIRAADHLAATFRLLGKALPENASLLYDLESINSLTLTSKGDQLIAVLRNNEVRVYDLGPIRAKLSEPAQELLAETERLTGLRLEDGRLVPVQQRGVVRQGEPVRQSFQQDYRVTLNRVLDINLGDYAKGRFLEARDQLQSLLSEPGVSALVEELARILLADAHFRLDEFDQAKAEARKVLDKNPNNLSARTTLVYVSLQKSHYTEALDLLRETLAEPGLLPGAELTTHLSLSQVYVNMGDLAEAEAEAGKALAVKEAAKDQYAQARLQLGNIYALQWRFPEAKAQIDQVAAAAAGPMAVTPSNVRLTRASFYLAKGEPDKAQPDLQELLNADPANRGAGPVNLVDLHRQQRQFARAIKQFDDNLKTPGLAPYVKGSRIVLAQVYLETGELDKAAAEIDKVLAGDQNNPAALAVRAYLDAVQGKDLDQAEAILKKLVQSQPNNLWFQTTQALVLARQGHADQALPMLEKLSTNEVLRRDPAFFDLLGDVCQLAKRPEEARQAWQKALSLFPPTTHPEDHRKHGIEQKLHSLK